MLIQKEQEIKANCDLKKYEFLKLSRSTGKKSGLSEHMGFMLEQF